MDKKAALKFLDPQPMELREEHRENLQTLADFLDSVPEEHFGMRTYSKKGTTARECSTPIHAIGFLKAALQPHEDGTPHHPCGTSACALGWAAVVFEDEVQNMASQTFPALSNKLFGMCRPCEPWEFMFSADWHKDDDTAKGAARRIRFALAHGVPANLPLPWGTKSDLERVTEMIEIAMA